MNVIASQIQFESCLLLFVSGVTFVQGVLSIVSICRGNLRCLLMQSILAGLCYIPVFDTLAFSSRVVLTSTIS